MLVLQDPEVTDPGLPSEVMERGPNSLMPPRVGVCQEGGGGIRIEQMAAARVLPSSPRGTEGTLTFDLPAAAGGPSRGAADVFAKEFQEEVRRVGREFCRLELALKRSCPPISNAWDGFVKFAIEHNAINEGLVCLYVCEWLAEDMRGNVNDRDMQRAGCTAIFVCCQSHVENREMMASLGLLGAAIRAMAKHPGCPMVQMAALQAILALCKDENNLTRAWDCKVLSTVGKALEVHRQVLEVQRLGKQVLALFTGGGSSSNCSVGGGGGGGGGMKNQQQEEEHQRKRRRNENKNQSISSCEEGQQGCVVGTNESKESNESDGCESCIICWQEDRTHAFLPCGHLCVCRDCANTVQEQKRNAHSNRNTTNASSSSSSSTCCTTCPVCRSPFTGLTRIFTS